MAATPIQVYLDSSDYSVLSNPRRSRSCEEQKVLDYLRAASARGEVQVRYSIIHIVEACHRDARSKTMAMARAALIEELSSQCVLRSLLEIIRDECERPEVPKRLSDLALDDRGQWYPSVGELGAELRAGMSSLPRDAAAIAGGNRAARRAAEKAFGAPAKQQAFIQEFCQDVDRLAALCAKHGIPGRIAHEGVFRKIFDQRLSDKQVTELLGKEIFRPQHFIGDYVDRFERSPAIRGSVRDLGDRLIESVATFRDVLERARQLATPTLASDLSAIRRKTNVQFDGLSERLIAAALREQLDSAPLHTATTPSSRSCAGIDALVAFAKSWFADLIGGANVAGRGPEVSDAGDALHAFYLPYVDVWRGDRYACDVMREKASEYGTAVVPGLWDLPERLESMLGYGGSQSSR